MNIMIDIETMGTSSSAAILSVAAVKFDLKTGDTFESLYENISLSSCQEIGLNIEADTVIWWLAQSEAARRSLMVHDKTSIIEVLDKISHFVDSKSIVWANSPSFDLVIIGNAYKKAGKTIPWKFYNERCVRTLLALASDVKESVEFVGAKHNPLNDCHYQIECVVKAYNSLNAL